MVSHTSSFEFYSHHYLKLSNNDNGCKDWQIKENYEKIEERQTGQETKNTRESIQTRNSFIIKLDLVPQHNCPTMFPFEIPQDFKIFNLLFVQIANMARKEGSKRNRSWIKLYLDFTFYPKQKQLHRLMLHASGASFCFDLLFALYFYN